MMDVLVAETITAAGRRGSSRPIVAETKAGARFVKLRGAGQGTGALVAEIIVAELAEALGLFVPPRSLVVLPSEIETADWDDELADLLAASVGLNLSFDYLHDAREVDPQKDIERIAPELRATIFWLDRFVMNPDRTLRNANMLWWSDHLWLIDHGASLGFQYSWSDVVEQSPREPRLPRDAHVFEASLTPADIAMVDDSLAARLTRDVLVAAVEKVDESFIMPLLSTSPAVEPSMVEHVARRRAAYAAYLWKRLQSPRSFLAIREGLSIGPRTGRPAWLTDVRR